MDMNTLGYFLYMNECEKVKDQEKKDKESAEVGKYKVKLNDDLVGEMSTQSKNLE